jgi:hypothetical protein
VAVAGRHKRRIIGCGAAASGERSASGRGASESSQSDATADLRQGFPDHLGADRGPFLEWTRGEKTDHDVGRAFVRQPTVATSGPP